MLRNVPRFKGIQAFYIAQNSWEKKNPNKRKLTTILDNDINNDNNKQQKVRKKRKNMFFVVTKFSSFPFLGPFLNTILIFLRPNILSYVASNIIRKKPTE